MQRFAFLLSVLVLHASCAFGHAQLVQVRPGYVKAPFVRVHKYADGSSFVRAPFVSVHSPGRQLPHQTPPIGHAPHEMNWAELRTDLCQSLDQLDAQLLRFPTGAYWKNQFATAEIRDLLGRGLDGPLQTEVQQRLQEIVRTYDWVHATPELSAIVRLGGFQSVHLLLHELLMPAEARLRRELVVAAEHLHRALERLNDGAQWNDYLALGFALKQQGDEQLVVPHRDEVANVLRRYDSIRHDDEIARLPSFRAVHGLLREYLQLVDQTSVAQVTKIEELPQPEPTDSAPDKPQP